MVRTLPSAIATEAAKEQNKPIDLYKLYFNTQNFFFAARDADVSFFDPDTAGAQVYTAFPVTRSAIRLTNTAAIDQVTVEVANADRIFSSEVLNTELRGARVRIFKVFVDALAASTDRVDLFDGLVDKIAVNPQFLVLTLVSRVTVSSLQRIGPGRRWQAMCNWHFARTPGCTFAFTPGTDQLTAQTVDATSTTTVIVDAARTEADNFWRAGKVTFTSGINNGLERRVIASDLSSTNFTMDFQLPNTPGVGDTYSLERGCNHTIDNCTDRNNLQNYGGFPQLPNQLVLR